MIKVIVTGAYGKMGREVVKSVLRTEDIELVGAVDSVGEGTDVGSLAEAGSTGIIIEKDLEEVLMRVRPDAAVDFTGPHSVYNNTMIYLKHRVRPVIGTTGLSPEQINDIVAYSENLGVGGLIAPNVAIGALLMMKFAAEASRHFPHVEIIELHHDQKLDAPSGTAIKTAEAIIEERGTEIQQGSAMEVERLAGARGGEFAGGIRIHSVRLPGLVAHQEVIFGGLGQTLTIRHDSITRESFMPGVLLGIRKVMRLERVVYGLDRLLFE
ncbi:4-hydroxy-tetrahydrodipicolinate reductase [Pelotomaculum sp. FP]|uniref:4-hydroxy-tetrahydrodipicolinate reductase n=1 Tax=Pelotomaculum sp. FP TaxID=261474 RepID=UPI001065F7DE|nr:4-hydroxy-tetrahydrodipicolinate reductase [Pelotomaculum sp. FP]TEB16597.1 4-hydroxy-tetrahydrodipicolinate reductase [Pelotomaculum sp. FP]